MSALFGYRSASPTALCCFLDVDFVVGRFPKGYMRVDEEVNQREVINID